MNTLKAVILIATLGAAACAESQPAKAPEAPAPEPVAKQEAPSPPSRSVVNISEEIRTACGISDPDAHFTFDSSNVRSGDYPTLDKLVRCFSTGPLAHREMSLIGHTDPRGAEEYNMVLGGSRADGVKAFLVHRGLQGQRVATTSRGEIDAKGTDESSWAEDRRVDIRLAN